MPHTQNTHRHRLYLYGLVIFLLGLSVGICTTVFGFGYMLRSFAPDVERVGGRVAERFARDFSLPPQQAQEARDILQSFTPRIREIMERSFAEMDGLKYEIAQELAELLDDPQERELWLESYEDYFPRPPRPGHPPFPHGRMPPPDMPSFSDDEPPHHPGGSY